MQQADASPPEPAAAEAVQEEIAPTPPQEKPEVVAPPEQKVEMKPVTEPAKPVPDAKPTPVKPKVVRAGRQEADRGAACAANDGFPQGRASGAGGICGQRWRIGSGDGVLSPDGRARICSVSNSIRPPPSPQASRELRAVSFTLSRSGGVLSSQPRRLVRPFATGRRDAGDGTPRRSRFPRFPRTSSSRRCRSTRRWRSYRCLSSGGDEGAVPTPSPRRSATTRSNRRTANRRSRPAASRAGSPPSARPTGRRRRRRVR